MDHLRRKPDHFLQLLMHHAGLMLKGIEGLGEYVKSQDEACARQVADLEREADESRRVLIDELNRTFVTPFDREDIFALSLTIDDILDYGHTTVDEMVILDVQTNEFIQRMVSLLLEAAYEINLGVRYLQERPKITVDHAMRAKALENQVETVYREALRELFKGTKDVEQVVDMLKLREIYRHLSNAADRGDAAANVLCNIVVKMR
jgi:predicted phosphate transport protein (TIGR00153 family)